MTIDGNATTIHHNGTGGRLGDYGLETFGSSSSILLVSPLTKETISLDNDGGRNYRAGGTIKSVDKDGKILPSRDDTGHGSGARSNNRR